MKRLFPALLLTLSILSAPSTAPAWNGTGHRLVAKIAWDNMTPKARQNAVDLLLKAPDDACLKQLFSKGPGALDRRRRDFFVEAATWPDIVRPRKNRDGSPDKRPCVKYHRGNWHFVDHFWKGTSGSAADAPTDLPMPVDEVNAVERLKLFRKTVVSSNTKAADRAVDLAWILHLVGDIHQPLHTSGRVTSFTGEKDGDEGGNSFLLADGTTLHSFWDGIVDKTRPGVGLDTLSSDFEKHFPLANFAGLESAQFDRWARASLLRAQTTAYPATLKRNGTPSKAYRSDAFRVSEEAIAEAGYRLADLLNKLFG